MVADIGLRLQEGIQELKLDQQLAPAREAMARTFTVGSSNFFKAVEGVRGRWGPQNTPRTSTPPVEVSKADCEEEDCYTATAAGPRKKPNMRPFSLTSTDSLSLESPPDTSFKPPNTGWGSFGSFLSAKALQFPLLSSKTPTTARPGGASTLPREQFGEPEGSPLFNGVSPGTSPTAAMVPPSIGAVLNSGSSTVKAPLNNITQGSPGDFR